MQACVNSGHSCSMSISIPVMLPVMLQIPNLPLAGTWLVSGRTCDPLKVKCGYKTGNQQGCLQCKQMPAQASGYGAGASTLVVCLFMTTGMRLQLGCHNGKPCGSLPIVLP